jgi:hypothetical protein
MIDAAVVRNRRRRARGQSPKRKPANPRRDDGCDRERGPPLARQHSNVQPTVDGWITPMRVATAPLLHWVWPAEAGRGRPGALDSPAGSCKHQCRQTAAGRAGETRVEPVDRSDPTTPEPVPSGTLPIAPGTAAVASRPSHSCLGVRATTACRRRRIISMIGGACLGGHDVEPELERVEEFDELVQRVGVAV